MIAFGKDDSLREGWMDGFLWKIWHTISQVVLNFGIILNILLGIGHPADVHFFKYFISDLKNKNHEVFIAAREKEITYFNPNLL